MVRSVPVHVCGINWLVVTEALYICRRSKSPIVTSRRLVMKTKNCKDIRENATRHSGVRRRHSSPLFIGEKTAGFRFVRPRRGGARRFVVEEAITAAAAAPRPRLPAARIVRDNRIAPITADGG